MVTIRTAISGLQVKRIAILIGSMVTILALAAGVAASEERFITLASTTSTENSGLLDHVLPMFTARTGIGVRVVAVGTGQAIRLAKNGDADILLVHHRASEERFVAQGFGVARHDVMYNDFVLVGPQGDPAGIRGMQHTGGALARIAGTTSAFASRGDDSGTHRAERALWETTNIDPDAASGTWYREMGAGMGATLNAAVAMEAYTLVDRATWTGFANKHRHAVLVEGDPALLNQYAVILVSPKRHPHIKAAGGRAFIAWLLAPAGQSAIGSFEIDGQRQFFPNASRAKTGR